MSLLQFLRQRSRNGRRWLQKNKSSLIHQWWIWGKTVGATGLFALVILLKLGYVPHPALVAVVLHVAADFTFQSSEMVQRKLERGRHLLVHSVLAGGIPLAAAGIMTGNPDTIVTWTVIGVVSHYLIDWTRKFGVQQLALAVLLDQACHLLTILVVILKG